MKSGPLKRKTPLKRTPLKRTGFKKRPRINAKPVHLPNGDSFDSTGEYHRYVFLQMLEKGGVIQNLTLHPKVVFVKGSAKLPDLAFKPDYAYTDDRGVEVWEDYKPRPIQDREHLIFKLWQHFGPGPLILTKPSGKSYATYRTINGKR